MKFIDGLNHANKDNIPEVCEPGFLTLLCLSVLYSTGNHARDADLCLALLSDHARGGSIVWVTAATCT